jgi:sugar/nucleoside kinase (ribokinase family)
MKKETQIPTIGIIGMPARDTKTFVDGSVIESFGGILFTALTVAALLPGKTKARPICRVGTDIARIVEDQMGSAGCDQSAVILTRSATQHSFITFHTEDERTERIEGGLEPLAWADIKPHLEGLDALVVNHITGHEVSLDTALKIKKTFDGPVVMDYHTLALKTGAEGHRSLYRRKDWRRRLQTADLVQMNLDEAETLAGQPLKTDDAQADFCSEMLALGLTAVVITLAEHGAIGVERASADVNAVRIPAHRPQEVIDTVGCGDVSVGALAVGWARWGELERALSLAVEAAGIHCGYEGTSGIADLGSLSPY